MGVLSEDPLFLIINSYTTGISPSVPVYLLGMTMARRYGGTVEGGELLLPVTAERPGAALRPHHPLDLPIRRHGFGTHRAGTTSIL